MTVHDFIYLGHTFDMERSLSPEEQRGKDFGGYVFTIGSGVERAEYNALRGRVGAHVLSVAGAVSAEDWDGIKERSAAMLTVRDSATRENMIGFARMERLAGGVALFCDGMVERAAQGQGVFHEMMRRGLAFARESQYTKVVVCAEPGREGLYEGLGFTRLPSADEQRFNPHLNGGTLLDTAEATVPGSVNLVG